MPKLTTLTPDQAKRALYIDFEGEGPKGDGTIPQPALLGVLSKGDGYRCLIFEEALSPLTKSPKLPGKRTLEVDFEVGINGLLDQAEEQGRLVLYYSAHEEKMVETFCGPETLERFRRHSMNAKLLVDYWAKSHPVANPPGNTLEDYCGMIGYHPPEAPAGGVAKSIQKLRKHCGKVKKWRKLPEAERDRAQVLFDYNRGDCRALRKLTVKAANSLFATQADTGE